MKSAQHTMDPSLMTHFSTARVSLIDPAAQFNIPHPRIGYYGIIDARFNINLLAEMADIRPEFQFILMGPIVDLEVEGLPQKSNIHYLGNIEYSEIPFYLAGWDCTMIPFKTEGTTQPKTTECLAAGKPIVSTSVPEVIQPYSDSNLVFFADSAHEFVEAIELAMNESTYDPEWLERVDHFLNGEISTDRLPAKRSNFRVPAYMDSSLMAIGIV